MHTVRLLDIFLHFFLSLIAQFHDVPVGGLDLVFLKLTLLVRHVDKLLVQGLV